MTTDFSIYVVQPFVEDQVCPFSRQAPLRWQNKFPGLGIAKVAASEKR